MTDETRDTDTPSADAAITAFQQRPRDASREEIDRLWEAMWRAIDFSWDGLADAGWELGDDASQAQRLKRWRAPLSFPGGGRVHGAGESAWKEASLQDYWRWSLGAPGFEGAGPDAHRLLEDQELRAAGLFVQRDGRWFHAVHCAGLRALVDPNEHGVGAGPQSGGDDLEPQIPSFPGGAKSAPALGAAILARLEAAEGWSGDADAPDTRAQMIGGRAAWLSEVGRAHAGTNTDTPRPIHLNAEFADFGCVNADKLTFWDLGSLRWATFGDRANFRAATFGDETNFGAATFGNETNFGSAIFGEGTDFDWATFGDETNFVSAIFGGGASFGSAIFGEGTDFDSAIFKGAAAFDSATFGGVAIFGSAIFGDGARFNSAIFKNGAAFDSAIFGDGARFEAAKFRSAASFVSAIFGDGARFGSAIFGGGARFGSAIFGEGTDFDSATFEGWARFGSATFKGVVSFDWAIFEEWARFGSATFKGVASFGWATFGDRANFDWATFEGRANFSRATFGDGAVFEGTRFFGPAFFQTCREDSQSRFRGAFSFQDAIFSDTVSFSQTDLPAGKAAHRAFSATRFKEPARFEEFDLTAFAAFDGATFEKGLIVDDPGQDADRLYWRGYTAAIEVSRQDEADSGRRWYWPFRGKARGKALDTRLSALEGGLRTLKLAMDKASDRIREQRYYRYELITRRKRPSTPMWERLVSWLFWLLSDYGGSMWRPFVSFFVITISFAFFYFAWANALDTGLARWSDGTGSASAIGFSMGQAFRPFGVWWGPSMPAIPISGLDTAPWEVRIAHAAGTAGWVGIKALATIQSFFSLVLLFLFALAVRRRFQIT